MPGKAFSAVLLLPELIKTAREAGRLIMGHYGTGFAVEKKDDGFRVSDVTIADREADALIVAALERLTPDILIVSEEGAKPDVSGAPCFWLVDALDGTRSFIRGRGHFTVNIGLIENTLSSFKKELAFLPSPLRGDTVPVARGIPVLGVVYDPADDAMYWGSAGEGAFRQMAGGAVEPICTRQAQKGSLTAIVSHSHLSKATELFLNQHGVTERMPCASSVKFCYLAEGRADIYPRFGPTMEWDTAAGHAILLAAGGSMTTAEGKPYYYGKNGFLNGDFVANGG